METLKLEKKLERRAGRELIIDEGFVWLHSNYGWLPWIEIERITFQRIDALKQGRLLG